MTRLALAALTAALIAAPLRAQLPDSGDGLTAPAPVLHGEQTILRQLVAFHTAEMNAAALAADRAADPGVRALAQRIRQEHADAIQGLRGIADQVVDDPAMRRRALTPSAEAGGLSQLSTLDPEHVGPAWLAWERADLRREGSVLRDNLMPGAGREELRSAVGATIGLVDQELNLLDRRGP